MKVNSDLTKIEQLILFCVEQEIQLFPFITGEDIDVYNTEHTPYDVYSDLISKGYISVEEQEIIKPWYTVTEGEAQIAKKSDFPTDKEIDKFRELFSLENTYVANRMQSLNVVKLALSKFFEQHPSIEMDEVIGATKRMINYYTGSGNSESIPNVVKFIVGTTDTNSLYYWIDEYRLQIKNKENNIDNKLL